MKFILSNINFKDFIYKFEFFKNYSFENAVENYDNYNVETFKNDYYDWEQAVENFLKLSILPNCNLFLEILEKKKSSISDELFADFGDLDKNLKEFNKIKRKIQQKKENIQTLIDYINVSDCLKGFDDLRVTDIQSKIDFLLSKLNYLYGDNYYSIKTIFEVNDIEFRKDEPIELAELLKKRDYVIKKELYKDTDEVKISLKGANYVERKLKSNSNEKNEANGNNINGKIDEILETLKKLGYGQEIIFNELDELKDLHSKLTKKNWGQLLKGKLLDLAIDQTISKDTLKFIYESLTNENFKLLK